MRHSLFAITALIALVFVLIAGQSYIDMDRKFTVVREMADGLAVVSDRDGRLFFRLQNDAPCGGDKYFYADEAGYSRPGSMYQAGVLPLTDIIDLPTLRVVKVDREHPLIFLEDKNYTYYMNVMYCCFTFSVDKK